MGAKRIIIIRPARTEGWCHDSSWYRDKIPEHLEWGIYITCIAVHGRSSDCVHALEHHVPRVPRCRVAANKAHGRSALTSETCYVFEELHGGRVELAATSGQGT